MKHRLLPPSLDPTTRELRKRMGTSEIVTSSDFVQLFLCASTAHAPAALGVLQDEKIVLVGLRRESVAGGVDTHRESVASA